MNKKLIKMSFLGCSSSLGINWIYDKKLLDDFSNNKDVTFLPIQHELYEKAENGFNVYPNHQIGDLDFMGEVLYQFHRFLIHGGNSPKNFRTFLYDNIGPSSSYDGYIEKYGKTLISDIKNQDYITKEIDKQLIGPSMYIIGYAHGLDKNEILEYTKVLTVYENTESFINTLDFVFSNLNMDNKEETLSKSVTYLPETYQKSVFKSFSDLDLDTFISEYSGVACGLEQSFPLIYYIVNHTDTFKEAMQLNARLGGASSARGLLIGAIYSFIEEIPNDLKDILQVTI